MSIRSWVRDRIEELGDWIIDKVLGPFKDWVIKTIEDIIVALRVFRHNVRQKIAEWMENDWFFFGFIIATAATIYFLPKVIAKAKSWVITAWIRTVVKGIKDGVVDLIDANKLIDIHLMHTILKVVWVEYREVFVDFSDAISQFAAEIGEGSAYVHAYFSAARVIMHGTNAVIGGDPLQVEVEWYDRTSQFFVRMDDRFARYARDPGRLYYDFMDEVIIPAATEQRDVNQAQVDQVRENYNRSVEVETGMEQIRVGLDDLVEAFPGVIEAQLRERWDPINEAWIEIRDVWTQQIMSTITAVVDAVEEHYQYQLKINAAAEKNARDAKAISDNFMGLDVEGQRILGSTYDYLITQSLSEDRDEWGNIVSKYIRDYDSITLEYIRGLGISPALGFEPTFTKLIPDLAINIPSPFVGDY